MNRNVKIGLIIALVLLLLIVGSVLYSKKQEGKNFLTAIERNITDEDKKAFEARIVETQNKLRQATSEAEKYNLFLMLGKDQYALGRLQEAKVSFSEALKINSDQYDVHLALFSTKVDMRDYKSADESMRKALSIRKGNADLWKRYIEFKDALTDATDDQINQLYQDAINDIQANGDAANKTDIQTSYARWLEKVGNLIGAKEAWKKAEELWPERKSLYAEEIKRIDELIKQLP